jgi:PAT family beta-lactamase induction signal transducer AmpG
MIGTRRSWVWRMQVTEALVLAALAFVFSSPHFLWPTLILFFVLGVCSALHDVAADGFYLLALPEYQQASFSGVRNSFYRVATICAQGGLVILVAKFYRIQENYAQAWRTGFLLASLLILVFGLYHFFVLPRPVTDIKGIIEPPDQGTASRRRLPGIVRLAESVMLKFLETMAAFFQKPKIVPMVIFLLLYRLGEAQLTKIAPLFLIAKRAQGGLGLAQEQLGWIYGTMGVSALLLGGILGGLVVSRYGLKFWLWPMLLAIHLPDAVFIWFAHVQPQSPWAIAGGVLVEQFGYGFGFSAFMLYMIYIARGSHQTSHYAICTGLMALGILLPGLVSGRLQEYFGYEHFFIWVLLATIPSFIAATWIPLDRAFGKKP